MTFGMVLGVSMNNITQVRISKKGEHQWELSIQKGQEFISPQTFLSLDMALQYAAKLAMGKRS